ncbi:hypothetical protein ACHAXR_011572 [Thalassiosira sp. AJA248-18]
MVISSLGFFVDTDKLSSIDGDAHYEVYSLQGHYADPNRTNGGNGGLPLNSTWDYRGDTTTYWEKIAEGAIGIEDLRVWPTPNEDVNSGRIANYFRIPFGEFKHTQIPSSRLASGEESVQSFYITVINAPLLLYAPMESWQDMHDEQNVMYCGDSRTIVSSDGDITIVEAAEASAGCVDGVAVDDRPILQIGEGVVSYPFPDVPYFYQPRQFMGSIYYLNECQTDSPSTMPSMTLIPSASMAPSYQPTVVETMPPSHSLLPTSLPSISSQPTTLSYIDAGQYGCHSIVSTDRYYESFKNETSWSYGIVFPMRSDKNDGDGLFITTLGFHVNISAVPVLLDGGDHNTVTYEVYALIQEGLYADPNRTSAGGPPKTFDHRGDFTLWKQISTGAISQEDLVSTTNDYFQIPWEGFETTFIPPYGGTRSFYLTLDSGALVYKDLKRLNQLGKPNKDVFYDTMKQPHPPTLLYGEGVIGYPFRNTPFMYSPKHFIGKVRMSFSAKVFYEYECPSASPSAVPSRDPSGSPSLLPSNSPSYLPSKKPSPSPSGSPSFIPSKMPSSDPSEMPTVSPTSMPSISASPTHVHFPSFSPSESISPSTASPTTSHGPSISPRPSPRPSSRVSSAASLSSCLLSFISITTLSMLLVFEA